MNILITSVGRRTLLVEYFKKELIDIGKLVVVDCDSLAPALYSADKYYLVPRINHPEYINTLKTICEKENIDAVLSLIDPELSILARHSEEFKEISVTAIVSPYEACELWMDKYKTSEFCKENGFLCAKTYTTLDAFEEAVNKGEIFFPVFIKPRKGSASLNINKARNLEEVKILFNSSDEMIIQEFLDGQELGVDVYVDILSKKVVSIFIKEKTTMRAGETDKAKSIKIENLFKIIEELVAKAELLGPIDIDVFKIGDKYYISEINPRFGGGYPLAYECGVNFSNLIINNLNGIMNQCQIGNYEENVYMMKHDTVLIDKTIKWRNVGFNDPINNRRY